MLMATKAAHWTARDLERLPDDGNRYEVVDGELFVTPAPSWDHQLVIGALYRRISEFVAEYKLGWTFMAPGDVYLDSSLVQPDIFVIPRSGNNNPHSWKGAPQPILVVEILSDGTARRDFGSKRELYVRRGIPNYWIVDCDARSVTVVQPGQPALETRESLIWQPNASARLVVALPELFRASLDE